LGARGSRCSQLSADRRSAARRGAPAARQLSLGSPMLLEIVVWLDEAWQGVAHHPDQLAAGHAHPHEEDDGAA
ncbi:hypothetical protein Dimus_022448, partial [Dionaea muscipula]